ncbi:MAG: serine/threonine protein kinase [Lentisphaeria bacterium]|nr:serine/threonine protein kinase [Lentisphaeria bacterium]
MRFRCPFCYFIVQTDDSRRGYPISCPGCSRELTVPASRFQDGCVIGDFLIRSTIGSGSVGTVYLATQLSLERQVALKVLLPEFSTRTGIRDFLHEARAAAAVNHINLIQSVAIGEEDGICYMAMPYISGGSVMDRIRRERKLSVDESLHIIQQAAEALHCVWTERGIVHRDIKPDNIMFADDGIVKITDFGMAVCSADWSGDSDRIAGSPAYMSPELFSGAKPDPRCDIYSLGVTLYQMLTGRLPFEAETVRTVAYQHQSEEAVPVEKLNPAVPVHVAKLVRRMMAKKPSDRFQSMEELLSAIWKLRQETAPDRELIPDVHTISVRRLDYEIQRESVHANETVRKLEDQARSRSRTLRLTILLIPVLIAASIIATLAWYGHSPARLSAEAQLNDRIVYFERLAKDDTIPLQTIVDEGEKIISEFGPPASRTQRLMLEKIRAMMVGAELRRLEIENHKLRHTLRSLRTENQLLKQRLETSQGRAAGKGK